MSLGFSVTELAPWRGGRAALRMGLVSLSARDWRRTPYDRRAREQALAAPDTVVVRPEGEAAARETAALLGVAGGLHEAGLAGWEDLALLTRTGDEHVLVAGAIGFATDWRLADKIGLPLGQVHAPTHGYAEKLAAGVEHFMATLRVGQIFGRANFFVVANDDLAYLPNQPASALFAGLTPDNAGERLWVRCERQTFRRLPETGAILFSIGVYLARLDTLPAPLIVDLATATTRLMAGEDERRGVPHYAAALSGYAAALSE